VRANPNLSSVGLGSRSPSADRYSNSFSTHRESRKSFSFAHALSPAYNRSGALCSLLYEHVLGFGIEQGDLIQIEMRDHLFAQMEDMVALNTGDYAP